jgi:hypothetical protein
MRQIRCPYCHAYIDERSYAAHEAKHRKTRRDGQQTDYVTLPEDEREQGDLDGVPQIYVHRRCGVETGMPEDIIRSYLKDPYLYSADQTFCCGCGKHVPIRQCSWVETDENLQHYFDRLRAQTPVARPRRRRRRLDDRPGGDPAAQVRLNELPDVDLRIGDGDGFMSVLAIEHHRLVIGTAPRWNWVMLVGLIAGACAIAGQFVARLAVLGVRPTPLDFCSFPFPMLGLALGVFLCRRFRNQYVFDAERNEIVTITMFGLQRQRIRADRVPDVCIGKRTFCDKTEDGLRKLDDPGSVFVIIFDGNGRLIFSIEGVRSDSKEVAFYLLVAVKAASILRVPLTFFEGPPEPDPSVELLWPAVAYADQRAVDRWHRKYDWTLRRSGFFRPEAIYVLIGLATLLAAVTWFRWLSISQACTLFGELLGCVAIAVAGAVLALSGTQPGLRPSPESRLGIATFIERFEIVTMIGCFLVIAAGFISLAMTSIALIREPSHIAAARERQEREERERPRMSYRIEVRPDGTRVCHVEAHNMNSVDIGLELMTKPEPEARERGVYYLERAERNYPRRAEVINALTPYLGHEKAEIRRIAVRGLGNWGDQNTIPLIEPLLNDPDRDVRRIAGEAIRDISQRQGRGER